MSTASSKPALQVAVATEHTEGYQSALLAQLADARKAMGLTQTELAGRVGMSRMTVQRAEAPEADPQLSSFVALALALNLVPQLRAPDVEQGPPAAQDLVHRGLAHVRTQYDLQFRDREREAAFAGAWEQVNAHEANALTAIAPLLSELVPGCSQDQASAAATVVQWLGSTVGFEFLEQALAGAGYRLEDTRTETPKIGRKVAATPKALTAMLPPQGEPLKLSSNATFLARTADGRLLYCRVERRRASSGQMRCRIINGGWPLTFHATGQGFRDSASSPYATVVLLLPPAIEKVDMSDCEAVLKAGEALLKKLLKAAGR